MKTHEVEDMLGVTKQALIYYEKEGLIHPQRLNNRYRDYTQKDIDILKLILLLRSMEISIDEIKLILNNQLSIREALQQKQDFIHDSQKRLEELNQRIHDYIKRREVKVSFHNQDINQWKDYDTLYLNNGYNQYNEIHIELSDIKEIQISMYSTNGILHAGAFGMAGMYFQYFIDLDILTTKDTYSFSILNNNLVCDMFDYFMNSHILINDPLHLVTLYHDKRDPVVLNNYINLHFKDWAKQYHLDNPRKSFLSYCQKSEPKKKDSLGWNLIQKLFKK